MAVTGNRIFVALVATAAVAVTVGWPASGVQGGAADSLHVGQRLADRAADVKAARANVFRYKRQWAMVAWRHTRDAAVAAFGHGSNVPDLSVCDRTDWKCWQDKSRSEIYQKGNYAGIDALSLAHAYAITGNAVYARAGAKIILDWARTLDPPLPGGAMFHYVAYPVGALDKFLLAYGLIRTAEGVTAADRHTISTWFRKFIPIARGYLENVYDRPWPAACPGHDGNVAPYGNGAAWALSLGALAAAVTGDTRSWKWFVYRNRMSDGRSYTWHEVLDRSMFDSGKMAEECVRSSLAYALYTLVPLTLVAEAARFRGEDLYSFVSPAGHSLKLAWLYYAPYLARRKPDPYTTVNPVDILERTNGEYNADAELAYRQWPTAALRAAVEYTGSWGGRGDNFDGRALGYAALFAAR